jgi:D-alanyl-D-alanine carboxypeptidase/D-alanyl-D-alanine-endopeptidase (penicillin-binding protein 4)
MALTRRHILAGILAGAALPAWAEAPVRSSLPRRRGDGGALRHEKQSFERLIAEAQLGGELGFVVADAATGIVLESSGADIALPPASVLKTVTAAYALDRLGAAYRFGTGIAATGPVSAGRLEGDLILAGGGDPTLDTDMLGDLAVRLKAEGLREVTGRFLLWDGALPAFARIDGEQPDYVGYDPALSGLNLNFNRVHFEWRQAGKGWDLMMDARGERFVPTVSMAKMRVEVRARPLFTYEGGAGEDHWTVASEALGKGGARWLPVRHPALYTGDVFRTLAVAQGIVLPVPERIPVLPTALTMLARHESAPLDLVLRDMLKHSTNLTAEVVGLTASQAVTLPVSAIAMRDWARLRHGIAPHLVDHSGLGGGSRISAADMVRLLVDLRDGPLPGLLKDHGMRDDKGKVIDNHPVRVIAKTGTLNFTAGLAGYILPPGGRRLAFAIFAADLPRRAALPPEARETPDGGKTWQIRARRLQARLIARWAGLYL